MYDIIGDIHGHADQLTKLLEHLGYQLTDTGYHHPKRKVIFVGDFIDRGEHLRQHKALLNIIMGMVNNGHAHSVMGNHEFNALAYHTFHEGDYLRPRTPKNTKQHQAFLNEFDAEPELKKQILEFFYSLPLWLELDGLRVVHACWDQKQVDYINSIVPDRLLTRKLLVEASTEGTEQFKAIETLLKGIEVPLGKDITFKDKDNHERNKVRVQWWKKDAHTLGEIALPVNVNIRDAATLPIPENVPYYNDSQPPCFVGHYWLQGEPTPLSSNVACLDYSVAKEDGKLVAYRWNGEQILLQENFTYV